MFNLFQIFTVRNLNRYLCVRIEAHYIISPFLKKHFISLLVTLKIDLKCWCGDSVVKIMSVVDNKFGSHHQHDSSRLSVTSISEYPMPFLTSANTTNASRQNTHAPKVKIKVNLNSKASPPTSLLCRSLFSKGLFLAS